MRRIPSLALCALAILPIAACSGGDPLLRQIGLAPDPSRKTPEAPAFVRDSRREGGDYMPVGVSAPVRPVRARTETQRKALEAELDAARGRNEAIGRSAEDAGRRVGKGNPVPARPPEGDG